MSSKWLVWVCVLYYFEHRVDNRCFVVVEQNLHRAKAFRALCTAKLVKKLGMQGILEGDSAGTDDAN